MIKIQFVLFIDTNKYIYNTLLLLQDIIIEKEQDTIYAQIEYIDIISVEKAILTMNGEIFEKNQILLTFAKSLATNSVWVGNVSESVTEKSLQLLFSRFGLVTCCVINPSHHSALVYFKEVSFKNILSHATYKIFKIV